MERHPGEHNGKGAVRRPANCNAHKCMCAWLKFHMNRSNSKLKKGGGD